MGISCISSAYKQHFNLVLKLNPFEYKSDSYFLELYISI